MKWATPAARAPGTNVSPNASIVSASLAFSRRNGTFCARASRGVNNVSTPPTVNASAPVAAPLMKSRRSIGLIISSVSLLLPSAKSLLLSPAIEDRVAVAGLFADTQAVQPYIFHAPAVKDAAGHRRQP